MVVERGDLSRLVNEDHPRGEAIMEHLGEAQAFEAASILCGGVSEEPFGWAWARLTGRRSGGRRLLRSELVIAEVRCHGMAKANLVLPAQQLENDILAARGVTGLAGLSFPARLAGLRFGRAQCRGSRAGRDVAIARNPWSRFPDAACPDHCRQAGEKVAGQ